jgi:hypothetical protein
MVELVSHEWTGALDGLAGGTTEPVARFRFDLISGRWWWSEAMYALHGFAPGEVIPSTQLMLAHKHPEDRTRTERTLEAVMATGQPFCCRHRILDASGTVHIVLSLGEGACDASGAVTAVHGFFIDVTASTAREVQQQAYEAVQRSAETRAVIEQAKGILIGAYGIDADAAFALLRWRSQHTNTRLRVLASDLVDHFSRGQANGTSAERRARDYLGTLPLRGTLGTGD